MILAIGTYYLDTGEFYISKYEVKDAPDTYEGDRCFFSKKNEEIVRYHQGVFDVFTVDSENPVGRLQTLISDELKKRSNLIFTNTQLNEKVIALKTTEESLENEPELD